MGVGCGILETEEMCWESVEEVEELVNAIEDNIGLLALDII